MEMSGAANDRDEDGPENGDTDDDSDRDCKGGNSSRGGQSSFAGTRRGSPGSSAPKGKTEEEDYHS